MKVQEDPTTTRPEVRRPGAGSFISSLGCESFFLSLTNVTGKHRVNIMKETKEFPLVCTLVHVHQTILYFLKVVKIYLPEVPFPTEEKYFLHQLSNVTYSDGYTGIFLVRSNIETFLSNWSETCPVEVVILYEDIVREGACFVTLIDNDSSAAGHREYTVIFLGEFMVV